MAFLPVENGILPVEIPFLQFDKLWITTTVVTSSTTGQKTPQLRGFLFTFQIPTYCNYCQSLNDNSHPVFDGSIFPADRADFVSTCLVVSCRYADHADRQSYQLTIHFSPFMPT